MAVPGYPQRELFAQHYLTSEDRLLALPEWRDAQGVEEAFEAILNLYNQHPRYFTDATNEPQTEEDFIQPVLRELGWEYEVQQSIPPLNRRPDYALLASLEDKRRIQPLKGTLELWEHVAAIGDAKRWQQDLDRRRGDETPSAQITNYLYRAKVRWGILTNGRQWRLYEQDRSRAGGTYYKVDLVDLLHARDLEQFKYFLLFFRRDAFVPVCDDKSFVELVFEESERYRTEVGDDLSTPRTMTSCAQRTSPTATTASSKRNRTSIAACASANATPPAGEPSGATSSTPATSLTTACARASARSSPPTTAASSPASAILRSPMSASLASHAGT